MNKKLLIGIVGVLTIVSGWITFSHIDWFNQIQEIVKESGAWGYVIFVATYAIATLLILPVTAFNIAGGAIYGGVEGLLLTSIGALVSALIGFILARLLGAKLAPTDERWLHVSQSLNSGGIAYSFAARLLPLIPYGVVSFAAGLSPVKQRDYLIGTLLGTPLGIAPFVFLGSTGVQMSSSHDVIPLLASGTGMSILIVVSTWYGANRKKELLQEDNAEPTE